MKTSAVKILEYLISHYLTTYPEVADVASALGVAGMLDHQEKLVEKLVESLLRGSFGTRENRAGLNPPLKKPNMLDRVHIG